MVVFLRGTNSAAKDKTTSLGMLQFKTQNYVLPVISFTGFSQAFTHSPNPQLPLKTDTKMLRGDKWLACEGG